MHTKVHMNPFKEKSNRKMLKLCYLFNMQLTRPCSLELLHQSQQRKLGISSRLNTKDNPSYYSYVPILENTVRDFKHEAKWSNTRIPSKSSIHSDTMRSYGDKILDEIMVASQVWSHGGKNQRIKGLNTFTFNKLIGSLQVHKARINIK